MKNFLNLIIIITLALVIIMTSVFAFLQITKSQAFDERIVGSLTTKLDTASINQVIDKLK